jgi:glucosamine--fructose-6-phosphate aminotransferase (isomerizing)
MKKDKKYTQFALCREMMDTPEILRHFKLKNADGVVEAVKSTAKLFLTGEGSSRIFPAKNAIYTAMQSGLHLNLATDGGRQAAEYDLSNYVVFGASNSGSTKEVIALLDQLHKAGHKNGYGLTAREDTKLSTLAKQTFVLSCGWEEAVAATKSVAEQALFYQELLAQTQGRSVTAQLPVLADAVQDALTMEIPAEMTTAIASAGTIYFAGRNDGVAEELTLKTNEITRKKSDFLEGTYAVHGIEEVMNPEDVVILINPFKAELKKIQETLVDGVGLNVFAVSAEDTIYPTLKVKDAGSLSNYVYLAAGWNILVEVGVHLGINLDKAERARKVGNEFVG